MLFSYWSDPNAAAGATGQSPPPRGPEDWERAYGDCRLFGDADVLALLEERGTGLADLFSTIRIPACRSDLARLALLLAHGGMYVDTHVGSGTPTALANALGCLAWAEVVLFNVPHQRKPGKGLCINGNVICARRNSPALAVLLDAAVAKLEALREAEAQAGGYVPYDISALTGVKHLNAIYFQDAPRAARLRDGFSGNVSIVDLPEYTEGWPFVPYAHSNNQPPGMHWTERQKAEPLFAIKR